MMAQYLNYIDEEDDSEDNVPFGQSAPMEVIEEEDEDNEYWERFPRNAALTDANFYRL